MSRCNISDDLKRPVNWLLIVTGLVILFVATRAKRKDVKTILMDAQNEADKVEFHRQLEEAHQLREFVYSIAEGKHKGFERKDYIAILLFNRCLQTHEAVELLARQSLIDDAWVLVRALVEYAVNAVYMLCVADAATADNFNDYQDYQTYNVLKGLKDTDEPMLRRLVSSEEEEKARVRFEKVQGRFDGKHGDRWCSDDALHKRAARVDSVVSGQTGEKRTDLKWLVNTLWRYASGYTHGMAGALSNHFEENAHEVLIKRKPTYREAAKAMQSANSALYQVALPVDVRLGGKNAAELSRRFNAWVGVK